jgi:hypothetical protein
MAYARKAGFARVIAPETQKSGQPHQGPFSREEKMAFVLSIFISFFILR